MLLSIFWIIMWLPMTGHFKGGWKQQSYQRQIIVIALQMHAVRRSSAKLWLLLFNYYGRVNCSAFQFDEKSVVTLLISDRRTGNFFKSQQSTLNGNVEGTYAVSPLSSFMAILVMNYNHQFMNGANTNACVQFSCARKRARFFVQS